MTRYLLQCVAVAVVCRSACAEGRSQVHQLQCIAVCCNVLQSAAPCRSVLQCVAVCCRVLQGVAVRCSVVQCGAMCCTVLQCMYICVCL